jgi:thymidylate synthase
LRSIGSYALSLHATAYRLAQWRADAFIYAPGDYHIYRNHLQQVEELLKREPLPLPRLEILDDKGELRGLDGLLSARYEHLNLAGYRSHGKIAAPVAV